MKENVRILNANPETRNLDAATCFGVFFVCFLIFFFNSPLFFAEPEKFRNDFVKKMF